MEGEAHVFDGDELERVAETLNLIEIADYGSDSWLHQHISIERLSVQATLNVRKGVSESVSDALLLFDKISLLIHDLAITRAWKRRVFPMVRKYLAKNASIIAYSMVQIQHEHAVMNLLQAAFFKKECIEAADEALIDVVDVVAECLNYLNAESDLVDRTVKTEQHMASAAELLGISEHEALQKQKRNFDFEIALGSLACLCHITHYMPALPLSVVARLINTRDIVLTLVYLLENRPWDAPSEKKNAVLRYEDGQWTNRTGEDRLLVGKSEGQIWLTLVNILLDMDIQKRYEMTAHRKATITRLIPQFERNRTLMTQIPILENLYRYVLHVKMSDMQADVTASLGILVEAVPMFPIEKRDWKAIAARQVEWWTADANRAFSGRLAKVYEFGVIEELLPDQPKCGNCGRPASQRCSQCKHEWYCGRQCQVKAWKTHKTLCTILAQAPATGAPSAASRIQEVS